MGLLNYRMMVHSGWETRGLWTNMRCTSQVREITRIWVATRLCGTVGTETYSFHLWRTSDRQCYVSPKSPYASFKLQKKKVLWNTLMWNETLPRRDTFIVKIIYWRLCGDICFLIKVCPRHVSCVKEIVLNWLATAVTCLVIFLRKQIISSTQLYFFCYIEGVLIAVLWKAGK
jgi:hypothetical protein